MPGVRFQEGRARITMAQVLDLLGFITQERSGDQVRGPCPVHRSTSSRSRCFSAHLTRRIYRCFRCGSAGNHLDLYAAAAHRSLFAAALELCDRVRCEVPWINRH